MLQNLMTIRQKVTIIHKAHIHFKGLQYDSQLLLAIGSSEVSFLTHLSIPADAVVAAVAATAVAVLDRLRRPR